MWWEIIKMGKRVLSKSRDTLLKIQDLMKIITVASDINNFFLEKFLIPSCQYFDLDLVILNPKITWNNHRIKDKFLAYYLTQLDSNEIILFTDAYDTMLLNDFSGVMNIYHSFESPIVFSSEINCWPEPGLIPIYKKISSDKHPAFLNSGGFIGKVSSILNMINKYPNSPSKIIHSKYKIKNCCLKDYDKNYRWSNQYYWTIVYFCEFESITLDKNSKFFLTLGTSLNYFKNNYHEYLTSGINSKIFINEFRRIRDVLNSIEYDKMSHIHFNNPICKHVFVELFKRNEFPNWIAKIFEGNKKDIKNSKNFIKLRYNKQTRLIESID